MERRCQARGRPSEDVREEQIARPLRDEWWTARTPELERIEVEGSYGYGFDRVTTGWLKASLRKLDSTRSTPWRPVHTYDEFQLLKPSEVAPVDIALLPSATFFRKGEQIRLDVQGQWFSTRNPLFGQFPAPYERGPQGSCTLHCGGEHSAWLSIPVIPPQTSS